MAAVGSMYAWRRFWGAAVITAALISVAPGKAMAAADVPVPPEDLLTDTANGEVSAADIDFVVKVRLAGLWEIPAGEMAQEKSDDPRIQAIGKEIARQHGILDELDRNAAEKLDLEVPDVPNADQQKWLGEMRAAEGEEFDEIYIDRLRAAHGKIFPAIATIRASTRNDTVRKLAQQANQFVATHMTLLESSGIVDFQALPTAPNPSAAASATATKSASTQVLSASEQTTGGQLDMTVLIAALAGGLVVGGAVSWQLASGRGVMSRSRRRRYYAR
ncbi:DUF4142 domain-containing protein [Actinoplanes sp. NPDC051851]|uniref:DUF4142 domain-containing protein n=1 Tax=Actinoplanes sp. NPDC051851 TaxID=3154753 RepID=UPI0034298C3C